MTRRSLTLFIKDPGGDYEPQFGFPALTRSELDSRTQGWPDLIFGGPGFCHPVWSWAVSQYEFKCNLLETPDGCALRGRICKSP